ncbi:putative Ig domain-containing protein [Spirosoma linguale]|uniref:Ig family protein n=1 Tax=Spirosoma linguale (strain ATCC 33905 / DSM 74 / LMG 10896 / Claus 1) TaxID=504472 RepID=D2QCE2_SPILD|nr:Ig family protein [Spirosoma linguale DSM 74]
MKQPLQTCRPVLRNHLTWIIAASYRVASKWAPWRKNIREITSWPTHSVRPINLTGLMLLAGLMLGTMGNLQAQTCTTIDYLYLNDPGANVTHKFKMAPTNSAPTEVTSSGGNPWLPAGKGGISWSPHGLGQDLNGNIYIGQGASGPIAKFKPDGTLVNPSFIPNDGGFNFVSKDGYVYVNTNLETDGNNDRITRYKLCDGSEAGYITLKGVSSGAYVFQNGNLTDWGLQVTADGTFYANAGFSVPSGTSRNTYIYRFKPTEADWTAHTQITGHNLGTGPLASGMSTNTEVWGITSDNAGNMYMVVNERNSDGTFDTWILKYDSQFNLIGSAHTPIDKNTYTLTNPPPPSYQGARGIIYYAPYDRLLLAGGRNGDCIAKFNPNTMTYAGALVGWEGPDQYPKTLRIATEACPTGSFTVDTTICNAKVGDRIFLANLIGTCKAPISGTWTKVTGTGITYNSCDQSFTVDNLATACSKFTLTNAGGTCGPFTITINVDFAGVTASVIAGNQNVCSGLAPAPFTVTTAAKNTGSKPIKYQWQRSISPTSGYADVTGATSSTYVAPADTKTRYYRVIATADGNCATAAGSCADTSNVVTLTLVNPVVGITANPGSCTTSNKYVLSGNITITNPISNTMLATLTDGTVTKTVTIPGGATIVPYSMTLTADGALHNIKVSTGCDIGQTPYTAPPPCSPCTLAISTSSLPDGTVGTAYNQTIQTTGGTAPLTFAVSVGSLPAGLSLNPTTGAITGTPTAAGTATFTIQVTDSKSCTDEVALTITTTATPATCSFQAVATAGTCFSATNTYNVTGTITLTNNTAGGTATITDGSSTTTVSIAPNATSASFALTGLTSNGAAHIVRISLSNCGTDVLVTYTAPGSCFCQTGNCYPTDVKKN